MLFWMLLTACASRNGEPAPSSNAARTDWPVECPQPSDTVHYQHATWAERDVCSRIRFACAEGQEPIESPDKVECGCGCQDVAH